MSNKEITVLVVDDQADFRRLTTFWLDSKGYATTAAADGKSAIELVKQKKADIIFMDLRMPVMDGVETIKEIRNIDNDIPIIVISAYVDDPKIQEAMQYKISGVFCKSKDSEEQGLSLLESVLRTHKNLKNK